MELIKYNLIFFSFALFQRATVFQTAGILSIPPWEALLKTRCKILWQVHSNPGISIPLSHNRALWQVSSVRRKIAFRTLDVYIRVIRTSLPNRGLVCR